MTPELGGQQSFYADAHHPDYVVDHIVLLRRGGDDEPSTMRRQTIEVATEGSVRGLFDKNEQAGNRFRMGNQEYRANRRLTAV